MLARVAQIMQIVESLAPKRLALEWDNAGLQVGDPAAEVRRVIVALDFTEAVLEETLAAGAEMVVTHHPLIFEGLKSLRSDLPLGRRLARAVRGKLNLYAAHTNLDAAEGGVNDILARGLGLQDVEILSTTAEEKFLKLVVFVPRGHEDGVRDAMAAAGAGWIGNYSHCTFQAAGTGTFKPLEGANPYLGQVGKIEKAEEFRLETILPESLARKVVAAMIKAHPYEEVAYDLYPLANEGRRLGIGRIGRLPARLPLKDLVGKTKALLGLSTVKLVGDPEASVQKVAVCGGDGGKMIGKAAFAGADALLTGDVGYHAALDAAGRGLTVIDAGHYATEAIVLGHLRDYLNEQLSAAGSETIAIASAAGRDVFWYV